MGQECVDIPVVTPNTPYSDLVLEESVLDREVVFFSLSLFLLVLTLPAETSQPIENNKV